jgi:hypothetical protein
MEALGSRSLKLERIAPQVILFREVFLNRASSNFIGVGAAAEPRLFNKRLSKVALP